jgi:rhodanese-related sulfurtransferase
MKALLVLLCALFTLSASAEPQTTVQHADPAAASALLKEAADKKQKLTVLDLRTPDEFKAGHLDGAVNIDFLDAGFAAALGKLDKSTPFLIHCQSGRRSTKSLDAFKKAGFKAIVHLDGGYAAWQKAGLPVVK